MPSVGTRNEPLYDLSMPRRWQGKNKLRNKILSVLDDFEEASMDYVALPHGDMANAHRFSSAIPEFRTCWMLLRIGRLCREMMGVDPEGWDEATKQAVALASEQYYAQRELLIVVLDAIPLRDRWMPVPKPEREKDAPRLVHCYREYAQNSWRSLCEESHRAGSVNTNFIASKYAWSTVREVYAAATTFTVCSACESLDKEERKDSRARARS